ncbi:MAG: hypothetical protein MUE44_21265 [Oscillatoriaceae cyanobacterium Prado104]|jgi:hypothetical protein|nr:hypothetical protein [Oscillatoriaceae cyanobacterium Prado104]
MEKISESIGKIISAAGPIIWTIIKFCLIGIWWLFIISIGLTIWVVVFTFCMAFGIRMPEVDIKPPNFGGSKEKEIEQIKNKLHNMTVEELLKNFGNSLEELEENNQLTPQQQKVVRKVRRVSPLEIRSRIRDVLTQEEEMEILLLLILRLLGILR